MCEKELNTLISKANNGKASKIDDENRLGSEDGNGMLFLRFLEENYRK